MKKLNPTKNNKVVNINQRRDFEQSLLNALNQHTQLLTDVSARLVCLEEGYLKANPDVTPEELTIRIARITDKGEGLVPALKASAGDKVRVTMIQEALEGEDARLTIRDLGAGSTLPKKIEEALIGASVGSKTKVDPPLVGGRGITLVLDMVSSPYGDFNETEVE